LEAGQQVDGVRARYLHYSRDESMFASEVGLSLYKYLALTHLPLFALKRNLLGEAEAAATAKF
jgi:hypothetical protein